MFRVMIVDDEPVIKKSLSKLIQIQHPSFEVIDYADNGEEAFQKAKDIELDLIITDVRMPRMDGIELIKRIREMKKKIKVVLVSGYDEFEYVQLALRHGAVDYILKPIKPKTFHQVMQKVEELLHQSNLLKPETRDWIWKQKIVADQLVEAIWIVNPDQCTQILKSLNLKEEMDPYTIKQFYIDLYRYIDNEINLKLGKKPIEQNVLQFDYLETPIDAFEKTMDLIQQLCNQVQESRDWNSFSKISLALKYIDDHFSDLNLTLQDVADEVGMSPSYFSRQFKEEQGISFISYVTKMKMLEAKSLLTDMTLKTYEVADKVGYTDYPHFTKTFKKYTGLSPKDYRKSL